MKSGTSVNRWRSLPLLALVWVVSGCAIGDLNYTPETTPDQWCDMRPCVKVGDLTVNEPLGTFLVYLLTVLWIAAGVLLLRSRGVHKSRLWLGIALVLGGIGAGLAGTSYQAFSYELKCAGREFCALTNGFEVGYSVCQAASVSAMLVAVAWAVTTGALRKGLIIYSAVNVAAYLVVTLAGVLMPNAFLLSFVVLMLFAVPGILMVLFLGIRGWRRDGDAMSKSLTMAALLLVLVQVAYFGYYAAGLTATLWDQGNGFYFSENDVLHVGMIGWLAYVVKRVAPVLHDFEVVRT
jgi:hypothetical protein